MIKMTALYAAMLAAMVAFAMYYSDNEDEVCQCQCQGVDQ